MRLSYGLYEEAPTAAEEGVWKTGSAEERGGSRDDMGGDGGILAGAEGGTVAGRYVEDGTGGKVDLGNDVGREAFAAPAGMTFPMVAEGGGMLDTGF